MDRYSLYVIDAYEISKDVECHKNNNGNWQATYSLDLSRRKYKKFLQDDNALFYQIKKCINLDNEKDISKSILYIDFDVAFNKQNNQHSESANWKNLQELTEMELKNSVINKLRWIFHDNQGISVSFDGMEYKTFVPFDRSSSMTKSFKLTFIDKKILVDLNKHLMLDVVCSDIKDEIDINKYWAYRGLYLSAAQRVENDELILNEETVIVVRDGFSENKENFNIFTAEQSNTGLWEACLKTDKNSDIGKYKKINTAFDGQGLIDSYYASLLNTFLKKTGVIKKDNVQAHSFQIRMPFTKGMLHEVAFHDFIDEFVIPKENTLIGSIKVIDVYGIERDLSKTHIVLTQSMFKCYKWIKSFFAKLSNTAKKEYDNDPMKFYFSNFKKYDHALYIRECDANIRNVGWVNTNKQFLSTLKLSNEMIDSIIQKHIVRMDNLIDAVKNNRTDYDIQLSDIWSKVINAVRLNEAFMSDSTAKEIVTTLKNRYRENICLGELEVEGENRYLVRDLMMLLLSLYFQCVGFNKKYEFNKYKLLRSIKCLSSNQCFLADNRIDYKLNNAVSILRNPHLSRPEQCVLSAFSTPLYKKFFGHLKNVVMIGYKSLAATTLGGADFDGDMVKVFNSDSIVTKAVQFGVNDKDGSRRLPIIAIPSPVATAEISKKFDSPSFYVVFNTFCNEIGLISNIALRLASEEYKDSFDGDYSNTDDKLAELCTIVTGLEIDASKNGLRPEANKKNLKSKDKEIKRKRYFEDASKFFDDNNKHFTPVVEQENDGMYVLYCDADKKKVAFMAKYFSEENHAPILEQLPGRYLNYLYENKDKKGSQKATQEDSAIASKNRAIYFDFMVNTNWKKEYIEFEKNKVESNELDKNRIDCVQQLVKAYLSVVSFISGDSKINWKDKDIDFILDKQYDDIENTQLPGCDGLTIDKAKEKIYINLVNNYSINEIKDLMAKIRTDNTWQFVSKADRLEELNKLLNLGLDGDGCSTEYHILCNFNCGGYKLLYLFLERVYYDLQKEETSKNIRKENDYTEVMVRKYKAINEKFQKDRETNKLSKSIWNRELIQYCREELKIIYGDSITEAIKAVMCSSEKYKMKFVWNVFEFDEIRKYICKE